MEGSILGTVEELPADFHYNELLLWMQIIIFDKFIFDYIFALNKKNKGLDSSKPLIPAHITQTPEPCPYG